MHPGFFCALLGILQRVEVGSLNDNETVLTGALFGVGKLGGVTDDYKVLVEGTDNALGQMASLLRDVGDERLGTNDLLQQDLGLLVGLDGSLGILLGILALGKVFVVGQNTDGDLFAVTANEADI